jgi:hypothetical protein
VPEGIEREAPVNARALALPALVAGIVAVGCGGGKPDTAVGAPAASASAEKDQNACHLLTHEEVSALVEHPVTLADQTEAGDTWSTCDWETADGNFAFGLTVYWSGGKEQWDTWRTAQGLGDQALRRAEGVSVDSVVSQGLVPGIGDAAYFSELLPSLVLEDDVLFEIKLALAPRAGAKFAGLATKLLAKLE